MLRFVINHPQPDQRIDLYLVQKRLGLSRSRIQRLISSGKIRVNGSIVKPSYKVRVGDRVEVTIPKPRPLKIAPEKIPLNILYEDRDLVVINKPRGMVVHPGAGISSGTLVNALLYHCKDLSGIGGVLRPGIVHRLDKDTSGVLVIAKNDFAHLALSKQFKERKITKRYIALVKGKVLKEQGKIEAPIGRHPVKRKKMAAGVRRARGAITSYKVLEKFRDFTLLEAAPETGRTHQIRVHLSHIGHPIVGDQKYGGKKSIVNSQKSELKEAITSLRGQALHAQTLGFVHPGTKEYMEFNAPLPKDMEKVIGLLKKSNK
ncbi:MAG TPA: RluA family pseudouridine synthase [bacterium]|nr:RluA family pseudouridine synthase [bacterium]